MNPITGPFYKEANKPEPTDTSISRYVASSRWYRQKKPYNLPLEFDTSRFDSGMYSALNGNARAPGGGNNAFQASWRPYLLTDQVGGDPYISWFTDRINLSLQKSLSRFNDKRGEAASLGVSLAQAGQALDMIANRLTQCWRVISALRKLKLGDAARHLGIKKQTIRERSRDLSGLQLEISFGWLPTIADVQKGLAVLNGPIPYGLARGASTIKDTLSIVDASQSTTHEVVIRTYVQAFLEVENPGMDLAQRLGLTDPLPIVYELIPFSFVANWFFNLEEFIGQYNGYHGVRVISPHYGIKLTDNFASVHPHWSGNPLYADIGAGVAESFRRRVGSLPHIDLGLRPSVGLPWQRALNAISLLIQKGIKSH